MLKLLIWIANFTWYKKTSSTYNKIGNSLAVYFFMIFFATLIIR